MIPFLLKNSARTCAIRTCFRSGWSANSSSRCPYSEEDKVGTSLGISWKPTKKMNKSMIIHLLNKLAVFPTIFNGLYILVNKVYPRTSLNQTRWQESDFLLNSNYQPSFLIVDWFFHASSIHENGYYICTSLLTTSPLDLACSLSSRWSLLL